MDSKSPAQSDQHFKSENLLLFFYNNRKVLLITAVAAIIVSSIISFLITPLYKAKVVVFPTSTISTSKTLLKEWDDVLKIGEEKEAEQMLQILQSDEIRDEVNKRFNLFARYKINPNDRLAEYYLDGEYRSNVSFRRTEFMSVEIEVMDKNADTAAAIANHIATLIDTTRMRMQKERAMIAVNIVKEQYTEKQHMVKLLDDSLTILSKKGIFSYEKQSRILQKEYTKALAKGDARAIKVLEEKIEQVGALGWKYNSLYESAHYERTELLKLKTLYEQSLADAEKYLPSKFIINNARPSEKKAYPVRWIIVLISTLSAIAFAAVVIAFLQNFSKINWRKPYS